MFKFKVCNLAKWIVWSNRYNHFFNSFSHLVHSGFFFLIFFFRWDMNMSVVLPETVCEQVVYVVGVLRSASPASCSTHCLSNLLRRHRHVAEAASGPRIGAKQYLAHHTSTAHWQDHFGPFWDRVMARKSRFDPLSILAPGHGIFPRIYAPSRWCPYYPLSLQELQILYMVRERGRKWRMETLLVIQPCFKFLLWRFFFFFFPFILWKFWRGPM